MSSHAGSDFKAQVLDATDIVQLIGQTVALKRRGRDWWGLCPFHQEKSPSFKVDAEKRFFFCFGCKAAGNAIDFVMKRDRVEFIDALRALGEAAGLEMPKFGVSREQSGQRQQLLDAHQAVATFFENWLNHAQAGAAAREYLAKRGFTAETIRKFRIGLAVDAWDSLLRSPIGRKFSPQLLAAGGLLKTRTDDRGNATGFYDTFRDRLMFPIRDEMGRTIAFGGRAMPGADANVAKYLNSPESPIFSKSRCVFGLDMAKQRLVETGTAVIVEGYTDVIMAHQFGASNVVAVLGVGMTEQHLNLLRRFANKIVLLFDPDTAGEIAVNRTVQLYLGHDIELAIGTVPDGMDPDEYLLKYGADSFQQVVAGATDVLTYKWRALNRQFVSGAGDLTGQKKAVEEYLNLLAGARGSGPVDSLRWGSALARVSRLTEIPIDDLNRRFKTTRSSTSRQSIRPPQAGAQAGAQAPDGGEPTSAAPGNESEAGGAPSEQRPITARDRAERWALGALLVEPRQWHDVQVHIDVEDFTDHLRRRIAEVYWAQQREEGEPVFSEFLSTLADDRLVELAVELVDEVKALGELSVTLKGAVDHLQEIKRSQAEQKHLAEIRRRSEEMPANERNSAGAGGLDESSLFEELVKKNQTTNLRRLGPVKRSGS